MSEPQLWLDLSSLADAILLGKKAEGGDGPRRGRVDGEGVRRCEVAAMAARHADEPSALRHVIHQRDGRGDVRRERRCCCRLIASPTAPQQRGGCGADDLVVSAAGHDVAVEG